MTDATFERYREALRSGHVAALRGRLREAAAAYADAAALAPDRALPWTSLGGIWLRIGDHARALDAFDEALTRAPNDETSLLGRAEALAVRGDPRGAALALDRAAEVQEAVGRSGDALDTLRRAIELDATEDRRARYVALRAALPAAEGSAADEAFAESLVALEGSALDVAPAPVDHEGTRAAVGTTAADATTPPGGDGAIDGPALPDVAVTVGFVPDAAREQLGREAELHCVAAESALDAGSADAARAELVDAARAFAQAGLSNAALEACQRALELRPADSDVHLELIELFVSRGWQELAADKAVALLRLIEMAGDVSAHRRVCRVAMRSLRFDPRIEELCA